MRETGGRVALTLTASLTGTTSVLDADLVVLATGYRPLDPTTLLGGPGALLGRDADGALDLRRDHRARLTEPADAGLYLVGQSEHSHGLSSTLLSTLGVRAGEVLASVLARRAGSDGVPSLPDGAAASPVAVTSGDAPDATRATPSGAAGGALPVAAR